jgi:TPR repeat protein
MGRMRMLVLAVALLARVPSAVAQGTVDDGIAAFDAGDYAGALAIFAPAAEEGDADAQFYLAYLYDMGYGVDIDDPRAAYLYEQAAR